MKIIHEIQFNSTDAIRLFTSNATARKNNLRIHYHSQVEISLILSGHGKYKVGNKEYVINAGDVFFFRPNEAHCITDIDENGMDLLNLHIAPYYLYVNLINAFSNNYVKLLTSNFALASNKINDTLTLDEMALIKNFFSLIRYELENRKNDYVSLVNNYISSMLIIFSRAYGEQKFSKMEKQSYKKLLQAVKYVDEHFKENITLDSLSSFVAYSKCYFSSVFKKCMGMSVWDYICIKRIEEALLLIKTTDKKILDIALDCGFNNTANFNKIFKKYTNASPNYFRN